MMESSQDKDRIRWIKFQLQYPDLVKTISPEYDKALWEIVQGKEVNFDPSVQDPHLTTLLQDLGIEEAAARPSPRGLPRQQPPSSASGSPPTAGCSLLRGCPSLAPTPLVIQILQDLTQVTSLPELDLDDPEVAMLLDTGSGPATTSAAAERLTQMEKGVQQTKGSKRPKAAKAATPRKTAAKKTTARQTAGRKGNCSKAPATASRMPSAVETSPCETNGPKAVLTTGAVSGVTNGSKVPVVPEPLPCQTAGSKMVAPFAVKAVSSATNRSKASSVVEAASSTANGSKMSPLEGAVSCQPNGSVAPAATEAAPSQADSPITSATEGKEGQQAKGSSGSPSSADCSLQTSQERLKGPSTKAASSPECQAAAETQSVVPSSNGVMVKVEAFCQVADGKAE